jgi:HEAT repeat protein
MYHLDFVFTCIIGGMLKMVSKKKKSTATKKKIEEIELLIQCTYFDWVRDRDERDIGGSIPRLVVYLSDKDDDVRRLAMNATLTQLFELSKKPVFDEVPEIVKILKNKNLGDRRREASIVFLKVVTEGYEIKDIIPELTELLLDKSEPVKFGIADSLAWYYAKKKNWEKVRDLLMHEDKDVRQEAAGTLENLSYVTLPNYVMERLKEMCTEKDDELRLRAALAIAHRYKRFDDVAPAIPVLVEFTHDKRTVLRNNAIRGMPYLLENLKNHKTITKSELDIFEPMVQRLKDLCSDSDENVRERAELGLANYNRHIDRMKQVIKRKQRSSKKIPKSGKK